MTNTTATIIGLTGCILYIIMTLGIAARWDKEESIETPETLVSETALETLFVDSHLIEVPHRLFLCTEHKQIKNMIVCHIPQDCNIK